MVEAGIEYNPETAKDLRPKKFEFVTCGETFLFTLQIPEYILARISRSDVMDRLYGYMHEYATRVVTDAIRGGYLTTDSGRKRMTHDVGTHLKNYIWSRFSITQEFEGNQCFEVAPTLQRIAQ
jgi:hypothetical protein